MAFIFRTIIKKKSIRALVSAMVTRVNRDRLSYTERKALVTREGSSKTKELTYLRLEDTL